MKIAVPFEDGRVFQHFGKTPFFRIFTVKEGKVTETQTIATEGLKGHVLAGFLDEHEVDAVICGNIGPGMIQALKNFRISIYSGVDAEAETALALCLAGKLPVHYDAASDLDKLS